jgi:hypothetical protein
MPRAFAFLLLTVFAANAALQWECVVACTPGAHHLAAPESCHGAEPDAGAARVADDHDWSRHLEPTTDVARPADARWLLPAPALAGTFASTTTLAAGRPAGALDPPAPDPPHSPLLIALRI